MVKQIDKNEARLRRHRRVRNKISGTAARPRLDVFRSAKHIYAQIIDDEQGVTLVSASTMDKDFNGFGGNVEAAAEIGKKIAAKALEKGITEVVFDRGGYVYHGRVKAQISPAERSRALRARSGWTHRPEQTCPARSIPRRRRSTLQKPSQRRQRHELL